MRVRDEPLSESTARFPSDMFAVLAMVGGARLEDAILASELQLQLQSSVCDSLRLCDARARHGGAGSDGGGGVTKRAGDDEMDNNGIVCARQEMVTHTHTHKTTFLLTRCGLINKNV